MSASGMGHSVPMLQAKVTVNTPGDKYEQEADRVADMVMRMPDPMVSRTATESVPVTASDSKKKRVQRQCSTCAAKGHTSEDCPNCKKKKQGLGGTLQRLSTQGDSAAGMAAPPIVSRVLNTPGSPLPADTRSFMESRFGTDFSHVRVHTDSLAAESAATVQAKAYTVGNNVVFSRGESPSKDQRLLAHELTHVLQQNGNATCAALHRQELPYQGPHGGPNQNRIDEIDRLLNTWVISDEYRNELKLERAQLTGQMHAVPAKQQTKEDKALEAAIAEYETNWSTIKEALSNVPDAFDWIAKGDQITQMIRHHATESMAATTRGESTLAAAYRTALESDIAMYSFIAWNAVFFANLLGIREDMERLGSTFKTDDRAFTGRKEAESQVNLLIDLSKDALKAQSNQLSLVRLDIPAVLKEGVTAPVTITVSSAAIPDVREEIRKQAAFAMAQQANLQIAVERIDTFLKNATIEGVFHTIDAVRQFLEVRRSLSRSGPKANKRQAKPKDKNGGGKSDNQKKEDKGRKGSGKWQCTGPCYYYRVDDAVKGIVGSVVGIGFGNSKAEASNSAQKDANDKIRDKSLESGVRYNKRHCHFRCDKVR